MTAVTAPDISRRDLRTRSKEIMDAVDAFGADQDAAIASSMDDPYAG